MMQFVIAQSLLSAVAAAGQDVPEQKLQDKYALCSWSTLGIKQGPLARHLELLHMVLIVVLQ
jgi:hypothetical protein